METSGPLLSSTRWTDEQPPIYISATYETEDRTPTNVAVRVILSVSAVNGLNYFGYNIRARIGFPGLTTDWVTVKNNSPSQWSTPYTYDFGWHTISQSAASTSFSATIYMDTNSGARTTSYSGTVYIKKGNSAPYWPSSAVAQFNKTSSAIILPENAVSVSCSWSAASDADNDTIYYRAEWFKNGISQGNWKNDTASRSFTVSPLKITPGENMFFRVYCRDSLSSYGSYKQSNTLTMNKLTPASLSSDSSIHYESAYIDLTRTEGSNLNGNPTLTYSLSAAGVTVHNGESIGSDKNIRVSIWRSGDYPAGPYIRFFDLQTYTKPSGYNQPLTLLLNTKNIYGSTVASSVGIPVNLRVPPSQPQITAITGTYPVGGQDYYVINRKPITLVWNPAVDQNTNTSTGITYTVQTSINKGAWSVAATGLTAPTYTYPVRSIDAKQTIQFKVTAVTSYGTVSETVSDTIDLHYYNPPMLSDVVVDRDPAQYMLSWKLSQSSSLPAALFDAVFRIFNKDTSALVATVNGGSADSGVREYTTTTVIAAAESVSYPIKIACEDALAHTVFQMSDSEITDMVPRYSALLTVREKGVGINAVAGNFADLIVKGTAAFYGGDASGKADGTLNLSSQKSAGLNIYSGVYPDAEGNLLAAQELLKEDKVLQTQFYHTDQPDTLPVRWRCLTALEKVDKDNLFKNYSAADWKDLSNLADRAYVDAQATIVGGTPTRGYAKFASGLLICWGIQDFGYQTITSPWGTLYESPRLAFTNFAYTFTAKPVVMAMPNETSSAAFFIEGMNDTTTTNPGQFYADRPNSASSVRVCVSYIAVGRWK